MRSIQGIVLAGGKSSRFGGDKALALFEGIPMVQRAVDLLVKVKIEPCVITRAARDYSFLQCRVENDLIPDKGPLGGLYTAFSIFDKKNVVVLTCDMPRVTLEMLRRLVASHHANCDAVLFERLDTTLEPFPGLYSPNLKPFVEENLDSGVLSMGSLIRRIQKKKTLPQLMEQDVFVNVNSKKEYEAINRDPPGC